MKDLIESLKRICYSASLEKACDWDESKHPRGNPVNAGQFARKGTGEIKQSPSSAQYVDVDGNPIQSQVNEEWRHQGERASFVERPRYEDLEPVAETESHRAHPAIGIMNGLNAISDAIVRVGDHYTVIPSTGKVSVRKGQDNDHVVLGRDERDLQWYGRYRDGMSTKAYNESLKAVKRASDDGLFMQSFRCDYSEDPSGVGRLVFSRKQA